MQKVNVIEIGIRSDCLSAGLTQNINNIGDTIIDITQIRAKIHRRLDVDSM